MLDAILQALSAFPLFYGLWQMGNGKLRGPFITTLAEFFTFLVGIQHHVWSLTLIGAVLFVVQARNFFKWSAEGKPW